MNTKTLFAQFSSKMHPERSGFDLSQKKLFTAHSGALLPIFCEEVMPSDKISVDVSSFTRTLPLNESAYVRLREHVEFFFVPYRQMWSYWDSFYNKLNLEKSTKLVLSSGTSQTFTPVSVPFVKASELRDKYLRSESLFGKEVDQCGYPLYRGANRLMNLLGYGTLGTGDLDATSGTSIRARDPYIGLPLDNSGDFSVNLWPLLAYQKIYYDYYRNQYYEADRPEAYNVDSLTMNGLGGAFSGQLKESLMLRYRPRVRDYYTNVLPSVLAGHFETFNYHPTYDSNVDYLAVNNWLGSGYNSSTGEGMQEAKFIFTGVNGKNLGASPAEDVKLGTSLSQSYHTGPAQGGTSNPPVVGIGSLADFRALQAIEKLLVHLQHSKHTADAQAEARFGVKFSNERPNEAVYLGDYSNAIAIGEVVATTEAGSDQKLGQTAGTAKGYGSAHAFSYYAKEAGVIMGIYSVVPELDYSALFLDPFRRKINREDYYAPEFDRLGMQPLLGSDVKLQSDSTRNAVLAWQPRYSEYKTRVDRCYGEMDFYGDWQAYTASRHLAVNSTTAGHSTLSQFAYNVYQLMHRPSDLDSIFALSYDGTAARDQFFCNFGFKVTAIRPMSITGEPVLGQL